MPANQDLSDSDSLPPFPELFDEPPEPWRWPAPPFDWRHQSPPDSALAQPCRLQAASGAVVDGIAAGIDVPAGQLKFCSAAGGPALNLPFSRFRTLTLTMPLRALEPPAGHPPERVPVAAHEREVRVVNALGETVFAGRSTGHVEADEGLYLFVAGADGLTLQRVFVPRSAYARCEFGACAQDRAAEHWITTPAALLQALAGQQHRPVRPIGQALLELGMLTPEQLERALVDQPADAPLGEMLVKRGVICEHDLQTAIAHKMGYPFVDLTRFPVDPRAARKLPLRTAVANRSLPLMIDKDRLIVVMDRPARALQLQPLYALAGFTLLPVLASKAQILLALSSLAEQDLWSDNVSIRAEFFATSR